jgi:hypothetical protein
MKTDALLSSRRAFTNRAHPSLLVASIVSVAACSGAAAAADDTTLVDASYGQPVKRATSAMLLPALTSFTWSTTPKQS